MSDAVTDAGKCLALVEEDLFTNGIAVMVKFFSANPSAAGLFNLSSPATPETDPMVQMLGSNLIIAVGQVASGDKKVATFIQKVEVFNAIANKPQSEELIQSLGRCLVDTISEKLGDKISAEVKEKWSEAYKSVSDAAVEAAPKEAFMLHKPSSNPSIKRGPSMLKNRNSFRVMPPPANLFEHAAGPIEQSWEVVKVDIDGLGMDVVHRWLTSAPDARALFGFAAVDEFKTHPECANHGKNILNAVGAIVGGLRDFDSLGPTMEHLGGTHAKKHVHAEQFPPLGRAIIDAIKDRLGDKCTPEVANAWESVYAAISVRIVSAMEAARALAAQTNKQAPSPEVEDDGDDVPVTQFGNLRAVDGRSPRTSTHNHPFSPPLGEVAEEV